MIHILNGYARHVTDDGSRVYPGMYKAPPEWEDGWYDDDYNPVDSPSWYKATKEASEPKQFVLRQVGSQWCLYSRKTGKKLGCHPTKEKALAQERAIQRSKHMRKGMEFHLPGKHDQRSHGKKGPRAKGGGGGWMDKDSSAFPQTNPDAFDTLERFRRPDGSLTPERQALHDEIVADMMKGYTPVDNPEAIVMGGGTAAGKSSMIKATGEPENTVPIDADAIKGRLPEYKEGVKAGNHEISAMAHEESSMLAKRVAREAGEKGHNILLDGTGDNSFDKMAQKVAGYRAAGAKTVRAEYVTVDTEVAVQRALKRGERTGRYVPEGFIRNSHKSVSQVVERSVREGLFDELNVWDNNGPNVKKIATARGKKLTIHDQKAWQRFLAKGSE